MPPKKFSFHTTPGHSNRRLDQVLAEWLPLVLKQSLSKGKVRKLIVAGAVYLNGKRVRIASKELMPYAKIEVYIDLQRLNSDSTIHDSVFRMTEDKILYEDEYLIAVNKPPGLPTQPTVDEARENLFAIVKKYLVDRAGGSPSQSYLGLHHRLDRDTSGVILFTKSLEANPGIAAVFANHLAVKTYQALAYVDTFREAPRNWTVKNYLGRSKIGGKKAKYCSVRSGGDFAHTDFRLLEQWERGLWLEARPLTGRTHQIRIHLSENKMPIVGDLTYGGRVQIENITIPRLMLHAANLTFPHPILKNSVSIESELPGDFSRCLKALQGGFPAF